jgi:hypothetical protein
MALQGSSREPFHKLPAVPNLDAGDSPVLAQRCQRVLASHGDGQAVEVDEVVGHAGVLVSHELIGATRTAASLPLPVKRDRSVSISAPDFTSARTRAQTVAY